MIAALGGGWLLWIAWLAWENRRHQKNLDALRLRVHVNGTRGKSSVTRLIAAGLRAGGYRTVAKVTGTAARIIGPDGSESPVARRGPANIREYLRTVEQAVACGADALVAECMALQPELQGFCERRLMRSHIGVITNVRHDHEEIMGWNLQAIAASLGRTAPQGGTLVTTTEAAKLLQSAGCPGGGTALRIVDPCEISVAERDGFPFAVEAENVALALSVCDELLMLQYAVYSVISPEGCASILWKTSDKAEFAAQAMGITADRLQGLGLIDRIVPEPVGGAHRDHAAMVENLKTALAAAYAEVGQLPVDQLLARRQARLQSYGRFEVEYDVGKPEEVAGA